MQKYSLFRVSIAISFTFSSVGDVAGRSREGYLFGKERQKRKPYSLVVEGRLCHLAAFDRWLSILSSLVQLTAECFLFRRARIQLLGNAARL